jgi:hypothetical protein
MVVPVIKTPGENAARVFLRQHGHTSLVSLGCGPEPSGGAGISATRRLGTAGGECFGVLASALSAEFFRKKMGCRKLLGRS